MNVARPRWQAWIQRILHPAQARRDASYAAGCAELEQQLVHEARRAANAAAQARSAPFAIRPEYLEWQPEAEL